MSEFILSRITKGLSTSFLPLIRSTRRCRSPWGASTSGGHSTYTANAGPFGCSGASNETSMRP
jgi:hypothetical protein